jgi:hypothetical protein
VESVSPYVAERLVIVLGQTNFFGSHQRTIALHGAAIEAFGGALHFHVQVNRRASASTPIVAEENRYLPR